MVSESFFTNTKSFSLSHEFLKAVSNWEEKQPHQVAEVLKPVVARVSSFVVTPFASIADFFMHLGLSIVKTVIFVATMPFKICYELPKDLTLASSLVHLMNAVRAVANIVFLSFLSLANPKEAAERTGFGLNRPQKIVENNPKEANIQELQEKIAFLEKQLNEQAKTTEESVEKSSEVSVEEEFDETLAMEDDSSDVEQEESASDTSSSDTSTNHFEEERSQQSLAVNVNDSATEEREAGYEANSESSSMSADEEQVFIEDSLETASQGSVNNSEDSWSVQEQHQDTLGVASDDTKDPVSEGSSQQETLPEEKPRDPIHQLFEGLNIEERPISILDSLGLPPPAPPLPTTKKDKIKGVVVETLEPKEDVLSTSLTKEQAKAALENPEDFIKTFGKEISNEEALAILEGIDDELGKLGLDFAKFSKDTEFQARALKKMKAFNIVASSATALKKYSSQCRNIFESLKAVKKGDIHIDEFKADLADSKAFDLAASSVKRAQENPESIDESLAIFALIINRAKKNVASIIETQKLSSIKDAERIAEEGKKAAADALEAKKDEKAKWLTQISYATKRYEKSANVEEEVKIQKYTFSINKKLKSFFDNRCENIEAFNKLLTSLKDAITKAPLGTYKKTEDFKKAKEMMAYLNGGKYKLD